MIPPIVTNAGPLLAPYDVLFCDVWGVTHDGHRAYESANEALKRFRDRGGTVILVSNAPVPATRVQAMLDQVGVWDDAWDAIVASGDIALAHVRDMQFKRLYGIGPRDRDAALFSKLPGMVGRLSDADAIICTGLNDDRNEDALSYKSMLEEAHACRLPFVCANPDLVVDVGGQSYLCAGVIAALYEELGGEVFWAGKPHPSAFETARKRAQEIRGCDFPMTRTLAIGDALRTDIKAAELAGINAVFVAGGIHRNELMSDGVISPVMLAALLEGSETLPVIAAIDQLRW